MEGSEFGLADGLGELGDGFASFDGLTAFDWLVARLVAWLVAELVD